MARIKPIDFDLRPLGLLSLLLSFVSLGVASSLFLLPNTTPSYKLLQSIDTGLCVFFLSQLCFHFIKSQDKKQFLKTHWIDIIASIPVTEQLRLARIFQIFRVIRLLKASKPLLTYLKAEKNETAFAAIILLLLVLIAAGSSSIYMLEEPSQGSNIKTFADAVWWTVVTISTLGYGDFYPVTAIGRVVAVIILICGVGIFSAITGLFASYLTRDDSAPIDNKKLKLMIEQQQLLLTQLNEIEKKIDTLQSAANKEPAQPASDKTTEQPTTVDANA